MFYFIDLFILGTDHFLSLQMPKIPRNGGKPAMERKRRARINESMSQLKLFIMEDLVDHVSVLSTAYINYAQDIANSNISTPH